MVDLGNFQFWIEEWLRFFHAFLHTHRAKPTIMYERWRQTAGTPLLHTISIWFAWRLLSYLLAFSLCLLPVKHSIVNTRSCFWEGPLQRISPYSCSNRTLYKNVRTRLTSFWQPTDWKAARNGCFVWVQTDEHWGHTLGFRPWYTVAVKDTQDSQPHTSRTPLTCAQFSMK